MRNGNLNEIGQIARAAITDLTHMMGLKEVKLISGAKQRKA